MKKELLFLRELKSVAVATVDGDGPCVRIADVMLVEDDGLYFLTARGKHFYRQLRQTPRIAVAGMGEDEKSVRVTGNIEFIGRRYLDKIFEANKGLKLIYPEGKRDILEVYRMSSGSGEIFDLSTSPPFRYRFSFGGAEERSCGYTITQECTACGACLDSCPVECIHEGDIYYIDPQKCLECGRCLTYCPEDAIQIGQPL